MEFSEEQLAEIETAMRERTSMALSDIRYVIAELRPKPKFAEGQLVYCKHVDYYHPYGGPTAHEFEMRPLNLRELGPAVKALRDAVGELQKGDIMFNERWRYMRKILAQFDATHGGE